VASPIRILHVVVNMNRGGAETLLMNLYRNIDRSKVQFDFLTCRDGAFDEEIINMGGRIHRIPYITEVGHKNYIRALNQFFKSFPNYKIVHSHMDKMSGFVLREAMKNNIPVRIAHSHNTQSEGGILAKMYKWYAGSNIKHSANRRFACSKAASRWLFGEETDSLIIKNGVDLTRFTFSYQVRNIIRRELEMPSDAFVIGHVGRFNKQKNHSFLIDIFMEYWRNNKNSFLILIGDGPLKQEIEQRITDAGIHDFVKLLGVRSNVYELIQSFDAFVFPSFHEGLPVTLIEAQAVGIPCFISNKITNEVDVGLGLVRFLNLENPIIWAKELQAIMDKPEDSVHSALKKHGYDIIDEARKLEKYYLTQSTR
jgi:glycosyltransferase involved in cell wall biosynthesis